METRNNNGTPANNASSIFVYTKRRKEVQYLLDEMLEQENQKRNCRSVLHIYGFVGDISIKVTMLCVSDNESMKGEITHVFGNLAQQLS